MANNDGISDDQLAQLAALDDPSAQAECLRRFPPGPSGNPGGRLTKSQRQAPLLAALALVDEALQLARDVDRRNDFKSEIDALEAKRATLGLR